MADPQPRYDQGGWPTHSRFVYEPEDKLRPGHVKVISTFGDLERALEDAYGEVDVNWPLVAVGLRSRIREDHERSI